MPQDAFAREAFEFIEKLDRLSSTDDVMDAMRKALARFGFKFFCFNTFPRPQQSFDEVILASRLPTEWIKLYIDRQYCHDDPTLRLCKRTVHPFEWRDAPYDPEREPRAAEVVQRAIDFGIGNGFWVPIPSPTGCEGGVWMGGDRLELPPGSKSAIRPMVHLMALYAFERVRSILGQEPSRRPILTSREREVLTWAARGKSAREIGEILNIAKRTVDEHAQTAYRKLRALNRTQAVALAVRDRIIDV